MQRLLAVGRKVLVPMTGQERRPLSSAEVKLRALDALEVAFATGDPTEAAQHARSMLAGLDGPSLERIGGWLAFLAVRALQMRQADAGQVQRWLDKLRVEAMGRVPASEPVRPLREGSAS